MAGPGGGTHRADDAPWGGLAMTDDDGEPPYRRGLREKRPPGTRRGFDGGAVAVGGLLALAAVLVGLAGPIPPAAALAAALVAVLGGGFLAGRTTGSAAGSGWAAVHGVLVVALLLVLTAAVHLSIGVGGGEPDRLALTYLRARLPAGSFAVLVALGLVAGGLAGALGYHARGGDPAE